MVRNLALTQEINGNQNKTSRGHAGKLKTLTRQEGIKLTPQRIEIFEDIIIFRN